MIVFTFICFVLLYVGQSWSGKIILFFVCFDFFLFCICLPLALLSRWATKKTNNFTPKVQSPFSILFNVNVSKTITNIVVHSIHLFHLFFCFCCYCWMPPAGLWFHFRQNFLSHFSYCYLYFWLLRLYYIYLLHSLEYGVRFHTSNMLYMRIRACHRKIHSEFYYESE